MRHSYPTYGTGISLKESVVHCGLLLYILILTAASAVVILQGASDEPYYRFKPLDCLVQVGFGVALLILWAQLAVGVVLGTVTSRLSVWFLATLLWAAVVCYYLSFSPSGYVSDMVNHGWEFR
ncbi:MAG: hypothetical protein V4671_16415 [Armatimonadota bacterium]